MPDTATLPSAALVELEVPAEAAFVGVVRSVVVTVATELEGLDDDRLDDLRLAVSEACTHAVGGRDGGTLVVRLLRYETHVDVEIEDERGDGAAIAADDEYGLQLIDALVDEVAVDTRGAATVVRLRMTLDE